MQTLEHNGILNFILYFVQM